MGNRRRDFPPHPHDERIRVLEAELLVLRHARMRDRKRDAQRNPEMAARRAARCAATWAARTPEEHAAHAAKVSAALRRLEHPARKGTTTSIAARKRMRAAQIKAWATKTAEEKRARAEAMNIAKAAQAAARAANKAARARAAAFLKEAKPPKKPPNAGVPHEFRHLKKTGRVADVPAVASLANLLGAI